MSAFSTAYEGTLPYVALHASVVDDLVNVVSGYTRLRRCSRNVQNLTRKSAHLAHTILLLLGENSNLVPVDKDLFGTRDAVLGIVWKLDALLHFALGRQRVYGTQGTGVGESREGVVVSSRWIRFRNYFRREDVGENTVLRLMRFLVLGLQSRQTVEEEHVTSVHLPSCA